MPVGANDPTGQLRPLGRPQDRLRGSPLATTWGDPKTAPEYAH